MAGLLGGKNTVTEAERISEFQVNQSTYGAVVPVVFGTTRVSGNIIDYYNFVAIPHDEVTRTGKGGGSKTTNRTWEYKAAVLIGLGEGEIAGIGRVWVGTDAIYYEAEYTETFAWVANSTVTIDANWTWVRTKQVFVTDNIFGFPLEFPAVAGVNYTDDGNGSFTMLSGSHISIRVVVDATNKTTGGLTPAGLTLFSGAQGQSPWAYTQAQLPAHALPYSGLAYVAGYIDLTSSGGVDNFNFELQGLLRALGDGIDCNPADIVNYIMTDAVNGIGITGINSTSLANFWAYCQAADLLGSLPLTDRSKVYEITNNLCEAANTMAFDSQGELKFVPRCEETITANGVTYTPDLTVQYDLDEDDFLEFDDGTLVKFERVDASKTYNQSTVEFINRANGYEQETVDQQVLADISTRGLRAMSTKTYHFFHTKARAEQVALELALKSCYDRTTYTFRLSWTFCLLEPGDIVTLSLTTGPFLLDKVPVRIETVDEDEDGELELTAKPLLSGIASPAKYTVFDSDRATRDLNADPGNSAAPVFFQNPVEGMQTFIATAGSAKWGGCNVWLSDDGDTYKLKGSISAPSRYGELLAELPDSATAIDTTNPLSVDLSISGGELLSGTQADAQNMRTLCWVDGELIAYATATLTGAGKYNLSYLVRGCYGTPITSHAAGSSIVRVDDGLFGMPYTQNDIGKKIYVKLASFNIYGSGTQDLSEVEVYEHTIAQYHVPHVSGLTCAQAYRETGSTLSYELSVSWTSPSPEIYAAADVFMRSNLATAEEIGELDDNGMATAIDRLGLDVAPWKQIGSGYDKFTFPGAVKGATYKFMVVARDTNGVSADESTAPTVEYTVAVKPYTPIQPSGLTLSVLDKPYCAWNASTDTDIDFYELRTDNNPGVTAGQLYRGSSIQCNPVLASRTGTLYLFAHNPSGHYSPALIYGYNFPTPAAPTVTITDVFQGFVVATSALPTGALGISVHINTAIYTSPNNTYKFSGVAGIYDVSVAFYDYFGEGTLSAVQEKIILIYIDPAWIEAESLSKAMMDADVKTALQAAIDAAPMSTVTAMQGALTTAQGDITTAEAAIIAAQGRLTTVEGTVTTQGASITTLESGITLKADKTTLSAVDGRLITAEGSIVTQAGQIALKAAQTTVDTLAGRVTTAEGSITTIAGQVAIKAAQTDVDTLAGRVTSAESSITANANAIALRVTQTDFNALSGTVSGHTSAISQNATNISSIVTELGKPLESCTYTSIVQALSAINLRATKANLISEINICPEAVTINGKYLHITALTQFDSDVIVAGMITSGDLTLTGSMAIKNSTGTVSLNSSGLKLTEADGAYTMFNPAGITWYDSAGTPHGAIKRMVSGVAVNGQYVRFGSVWRNSPIILLAPQEFKTLVAGSTAASVQCFASNISTAGFTVNLNTIAVGTDVSALTNVSDTKMVTNGDARESAYTASSSVTYLRCLFYKGGTYTARVILNPLSSMVFGYWVQKNGGDYVKVATHTFTNSRSTGAPLEYPLPELFFTTSTAGQYRVKVVLESGGLSYTPEGDLAYYNGVQIYDIRVISRAQTIIDNAGSVNFIAIESDANNYYTLE